MRTKSTIKLMVVALMFITVALLRTNATFATVHESDDEHNWKEGRREEPTCTKDGYQQYYCNDCMNGGFKEVVIPKLGHDMKENDYYTTTATCTKGGVTQHHCGRQECDYYEEETVGPLGHDFGEPVRTIKPSCKDETDGEAIYICGRCKEEKTETIKWEHKWEVVKTVAPTCTAEGEVVS